MSYRSRIALLAAASISLAEPVFAQIKGEESSELQESLLEEGRFEEIEGDREIEAENGPEAEGGVDAVPEPSSLLTFAVGGALIGGAIRRRAGRPASQPSSR